MATQNRRDFMRNSLLGLSALPFGASILSSSALAEELPPLEPSNPQAQALHYVKKAAEASDNAQYAEGETCANCRFFQQANNGCQLFPQNSVEPGGWCQSWTKQA